MMGKQTSSQRKETQKLLDLVRDFKETSNSETFEKIEICLKGYLNSIIRKFFFVPGSGSDDIYQEALYALATKAIPDYDETKGSFLGFAKLCIRRHIITVLKSANNNKHKAMNASVSIDAQINSHEDDDGPTSVGGFLPTEDEGVVDKMVRNESFMKLKMLLKGKLTGLEADILDLYLMNMSYVDIVSLMNKRRRGKKRVNAKTVDNALCRIKKKAVELETGNE